MKTKTILTALFLGLMLFSNAQENARKTKGKIVDPGPKTPRITLVVGYGSTMPSSASKDAYLVNSSGVSADVSIPFASFRKGWDGTVKGSTYMSLNFGGQYNFGGSGNPSAALPNAFPIFGSTSNSVAYKGVDPRNPGFRMGVGPQVNFNLGKFTISPMVLAEYFSMTQKELSAVQTTEYNGQTYQKDLWTMPETKTSGLAFTPKVRVHYMITQSFGLFADASYILGPKMETQLSTLVPTGPPNQDGFYEADYVNNGTYVKGETKSTSYSALGFNVGLSFSFGGYKGWNGKAEASKTATDDIYKGWNGVAESEYKGWNGVAESEYKGWNGTVQESVKITSPSNGEDVDQSPTFRWTPCLPRPQYPVSYRLKVWQLMQGQTSIQAMKSNKPLLEKDVKDVTEFTASNIITGPCKPPYMCDFVWSVQALDQTGKELSSSEPTQFSIRKGWDGTVKGNK